MGALYAASKHAILGLCRSLHLELTSQNISTSMVAPFFIDTPMLGDVARKLLAGQKLAQLEDVINAFVYGSTQTKEANGQVIATE